MNSPGLIPEMNIDLEKVWYTTWFTNHLGRESGPRYGPMKSGSSKTASPAGIVTHQSLHIPVECQHQSF
jgi:hypothetical protein